MISKIFENTIKELANTSQLFKYLYDNMLGVAFDKDTNTFIIIVNQDIKLPLEHMEVIKRVLENNPKIIDKLRLFSVKNYNVAIAVSLHDEDYIRITRKKVMKMNSLRKRIDAMIDTLNKYLINYEATAQEVNNITRIISRANNPDVLKYLLDIFMVRVNNERDELGIRGSLIKKVLETIHSDMFGNMYELPLSEYITDEFVDEIMKIIEKYNVVDWKTVPGKTKKQKVVNFLRTFNLDELVLVLAGEKMFGGGKL